MPKLHEYNNIKINKGKLILYEINKFPVVILRLFLVYGPNQSTNRILPQIITNSLQNKKFPTTKGSQYCDFCFVDDVVSAIFKALNTRKAVGKIFNIGSGVEYNIEDYAKIIMKHIKDNLKII